MEGRRQARRLPSERKYYQSIHAKCARLGVWHAEFEVPARRLAKIYVRIADVESRMQSADFSPVVEHTNKNGSTNLVKNPLIGQIDALYDQALTYERELGLTPAALKRITDAATVEKRTDPLSELMKRAGEF